MEMFVQKHPHLVQYRAVGVQGTGPFFMVVRGERAEEKCRPP